MFRREEQLEQDPHKHTFLRSHLLAHYPSLPVRPHATRLQRRHRPIEQLAHFNLELILTRLLSGFTLRLGGGDTANILLLLDILTHRYLARRTSLSLTANMHIHGLLINPIGLRARETAILRHFRRMFLLAIKVDPIGNFVPSFVDKTSPSLIARLERHLALQSGDLLVIEQIAFFVAVLDFLFGHTRLWRNVDVSLRVVGFGRCWALRSLCACRGRATGGGD